MADLEKEKEFQEAIKNDHQLACLWMIANEIKSIKEILFYVCFEENGTKENKVVKQ